MIRTHKPAQPPSILRVQGTQRRRTHCANYTRNEADFCSGNKTFSFDNAIYGHSSVKEALIAAQYGKCAFCERKVDIEGDIEHFRPKSACCQEDGEALSRPGYYWLAYDWDNLLLSCKACNQQYKRNYFPLADPTKRALSHHQSIANESPLLIHPAQEDPAAHINFREEVAYPIDDSPRGKATIEILGLNKNPMLREKRLNHLGRLKQLHETLLLEPQLAQITGGSALVERARAALLMSLQDASEFAALSRAAYHNNFNSPLL